MRQRTPKGSGCFESDSGRGQCPDSLGLAQERSLRRCLLSVQNGVFERVKNGNYDKMSTLLVPS